jgi:uncharacterized membrane protein YadS
MSGTSASAIYYVRRALKEKTMTKWIVYIAAIVIFGVGGALLYNWTHREDK